MEHNKKAEIFKEFLKFKPGLVQLMKECNHSFSVGDINIHHMEGDIWSHTCMVYNQFLYSDSIRSLFKNNFIMLCTAISILTHDTGKIYTRSSDIDGKVKMYGHSFASIPDSVDFIHYLNNKGYFPGFDVSKIYETVITAVGNHIDFFRVDNEKRWLLCNKDPDIAYVSGILALCDQRGRIHKTHGKFPKRNSELHEFLYNLNYYNFNYKKVNPSPSIFDCDVIFFCGVPGSGKTSFSKSEKFDHKEISIDDIYVEEFKKSKDFSEENGFTEKELYHEAFKFCKKIKLNYNDIYLKKIREILQDGDKVILDNTNLTKKRKKRINAINNGKEKRYKFGCYYFCVPNEEIKIRNETRSDKSLDKKTLNWFKYNQVPPTLDEGFDTIIYKYSF